MCRAALLAINAGSAYAQRMGIGEVAEPKI